MIKRSLVRYHGGKWRLAPWIISHFPAHRVYVEPFGGAGSVLLKKPKAWAEVYNDLDGEMVNLFRIVRDRGPELRHQLELTPFARAEFELAYEAAQDPLEQARRTVVKSAMGRASSAITQTRKASFRVYTGPGRPAPAMQDWANYPASLDSIIARLQGVAIEKQDAQAVMAAHDSVTTLHYVDPPYLPASRDSGRDYRHEMTISEHEQLLAFLLTLKGMVVLSGYSSQLYDDALAGWTRVEIHTKADSAKARSEILWLSPSCGAPRA